MKRGIAFLLVAAFALGAAWVAAARLPRVLARMDFFQVRELRVRGNRFLTPDDAIATVAVQPGASIWDDRSPWEERLASHPLVKSARVRRRPPGALILDVVEQEPVALVASPTLEPVDEEGNALPIDPALHRLDLPLITPWARGGTLSPAQRRTLAEEVARLARVDPEFLARLSELSLDRRGDLRARLFDPVLTLYIPPGAPSRRIREGFIALADAGDRFQGRIALDLDLRYQDQVVVRLAGAGGN